MLNNGLFGGANPEEITGFYTGLKLTDSIGEWGLISLDDNINLGANGNTITKVISFWMKNSNPQSSMPLQRIIANRGTTTEYFYLDFVTDDDGTTQREMILRTATPTAPPGYVTLNWLTGIEEDDGDWHHYLIHITYTSGAFPGSFRATAYVDGTSLGEDTTGGPGTYGGTIQFRQSGGLGFGRAPDNTVVYSDFCIGQLWVGPSNTTDFDIRDWYFEGAVYLGSDGRQGSTKQLETPYIYLPFDYNFPSVTVYENSTAVTADDDNKCNT